MYFTGLQKIIVTGTNLEISEKAKNLASLHPGFLYFTAGLLSSSLSSCLDAFSFLVLISLFFRYPSS